MSGGWAGSRRRDGLPSWWPVTVRRILERDPVCRCGGCPKCLLWKPVGSSQQSCHRSSAEVDHIVRGDNHKDTNLRGICKPCHALKSSTEGNQAKATRRRPTRPSEKHPGDMS